jgi:hypothetical protein
MQMLRIRLFRKRGEKYYEYDLIFVDTNDLGDAGNTLVEKYRVEVGDIVYMGDAYLQLTQVEPKIQWTALHPQRPEVQGLYDKAVWVERLSGGVLQ